MESVNLFQFDVAWNTCKLCFSILLVICCPLFHFLFYFAQMKCLVFLICRNYRDVTASKKPSLGLMILDTARCFRAISCQWFYRIACLVCNVHVYRHLKPLTPPAPSHTPTPPGLCQCIDSPEGVVPHRLTFSWWGCYGLCLRHKPTELAHSLFWCCICVCLYGPFTRISFHKFSWQFSAVSLCFSGPISALLVLSTIYLFVKVSLRLDIILCGWLGLKHLITN